MTTETVRGSELYEQVILPIYGIRYADELEAHRTELAKYEKARRGREEVSAKIRDGWFVGLETAGFVTTQPPKSLRWEKVDGEVFVVKPTMRVLVPYRYQEYDRGMGFTTHAANQGLLAGSRFNRELSHRRVADYAAQMLGGMWRDLLSDPITITDDGQVINGQHRLAAAARVTEGIGGVTWEKAKAKGHHDPLFLVVWGVDPQEALHADLSKRTAKDQTTIVSKVAGELIPPTPAVTEDEILEAAVGRSRD